MKRHGWLAGAYFTCLNPRYRGAEGATGNSGGHVGVENLRDSAVSVVAVVGATRETIPTGIDDPGHLAERVSKPKCPLIR
jgi:hypothetical protein